MLTRVRPTRTDSPGLKNIGVQVKRLLSALLAVSMLMVACGRSPAAVVAAAPERLREAETARFTMNMTMTGQGLPSPLEMQVEGEADFAQQRMRMTLGGIPGAGTMEAIEEGTVMYLRMPAAARMLPRGKSWVRFDLEELGRQAGVDVDQLMQLSQQNDPTAMLATLRGASEEVEKVGQEQVRGVDTTHYRATVVTEKALANAPQEVRKDVDQLLKSTNFPDRYPVDVWMDGEGLARRMKMSLQLTPAEAKGPLSQDMTMEFFDFGSAVQVKPPPPEQTVDLADLLGTRR